MKQNVTYTYWLSFKKITGGVNAHCRVVDTLPVRTMICECLPGYRGNAAIRCDLRKYFKCHM